MNQYMAFYGTRSTEVVAESAYDAVQVAREIFNTPKSKKHLVSVVLTGVKGKQVYTSTQDL